MSQYKTKEEDEFAPEVSQWLLSLSETQGKSANELSYILLGMMKELMRRNFISLAGYAGQASQLIKKYPDNAKRSLRECHTQSWANGQRLRIMVKSSLILMT